MEKAYLMSANLNADFHILREGNMSLMVIHEGKLSKRSDSLRTTVTNIKFDSFQCCLWPSRPDSKLLLPYNQRQDLDDAREHTLKNLVLCVRLPFLIAVPYKGAGCGKSCKRRQRGIFSFLQ